MIGRSSIGRVLGGVLVFQLFIAGFLIIGDMREGIRLPSFGPSAPRTSEPVRPGDQRRLYSPDYERPPLNPARDPGDMPERLTLTESGEAGVWRLEGTIAAGDGARIADRIDSAEPAVETVILQSPGGSVRDALELGRHLRAGGIGTRLLRGEICYSACPYLFAGGETREVEEGASVGVHQHYFGESTILPAFVAVEDIQRGQGEVMIYLEDMGIDPLVMSHALTTPADEIYLLLPEELERYNFVTDEAG
ncbi:MAG: hypothetical protein CML50_23765 [Rhodobacteraceae bacterium]|jgi:hypothetical protein|uniref:Putative periplasmic protein n=1 Tax=Salipiger profundus TaxID=1229727 RepID=A0A1U7D0E2_9RHOB|nr:MULTISPECIES: hypothetical protein [Salipiger]APX21611.1 putative periplasmic protein [Salipiger profundus]MAB09005.1 hypothetical protein [Paracoccaceae bacterium]GGA01125.1 hypothetical protein GCM10011326_10440 [Salipiger profundus]SFC13449.1 hypothetical protein SAMN05444415_102199 [Salipiger profundus]